MREVTISQTLSAPVNFIVHTLADVNKKLVRGRPFFVDMLKQGITLYEAEDHPFSTPQNPPAEQAHDEAQCYFAEWFGTAAEFAAGAEFHASRGNEKIAAFNLHQAAERFYHCTLLVLKLHSPKSHKLNFLRSQCEDIAPSLIEAWPRDDNFSRRCFELLRQAYVNARYSPHYKITAEELAWLGERVAILQTLVETLCLDRLDEKT